MISTLTPRERKVLILRFGLNDGQDRTLEEVGKAISVGPERVRQILGKAIRKMRHPSRANRIAGHRPSVAAFLKKRREEEEKFKIDMNWK